MSTRLWVTILAQEEAEASSNVSLVLPETNELIAGIVAFLIVFFFVWKWAIPAINRTLEARQKAILDALKDDEVPGFQKLLDEERKPFKGTDADAWFEDAETLAKLKRGVSGFLKQPKPADRDRRLMVQALEAQRNSMRTGALKGDVDVLISRLAKGKER